MRRFTGIAVRVLTLLLIAVNGDSAIIAREADHIINLWPAKPPGPQVNAGE